MTSPAGTSARSSRATLRRPSRRARGSLGARCSSEALSASMCTSLCGRQAEAALPCRAAFDFAYDEETGAVSAPVGVESLLTRLFRRPGKPAAAELPAGDMRALDGLARILRTVGVLNK